MDTDTGLRNEMNSVGQNLSSTDRAQITFQVRPGITFPDWSVVYSDKAKNALLDIIEAFGFEKSFANYNPKTDQVHTSVLLYMAAHGRAPTIETLVELTGFTPSKTSQILTKLESKDLVVLDETTGSILGAYPITERKTEHLLEIGGRTIHAMCAIDALGAGSMFNADTKIISSCRATGLPVIIELKENGVKLNSVDPETAIVWCGIQISNGCAADSLCSVLAFFSSDGALEKWRSSENQDTPGYRLTLDEGIQVGRALFDPFLKT